MRTFKTYITLGLAWLCLLVLAGCASHPYKTQLNQVESEALKSKTCIANGKEEKYICAQKLYIGIQLKVTNTNVFLLQ